MANLYPKKLNPAFDLRSKLIQSLALAALVLLTPFSINNFIQGRYFLGAGSLAIVIILVFDAWSILRGRYYPLLTSLGLVPVIFFFLLLSIYKQGMVGFLWCYPTVISFYLVLPERQAWIANAVLLIVTLPRAWEVLEHPLAARATATLLAVSVFTVIFVRVITDQQRQLESLAMTDALTGVLNRISLQDSLEQGIDLCHRTGIPMTLIALDLDYFKTINDTYGHDAGDRVLQGVGELIQNRIRRTDKVFRLGGEEFLVLLYGTDAENSRQVAEELRQAIAHLSLIPNRPITASIGVATLLPQEDWTLWMKRADVSLYRAKSNGRNRVDISSNAISRHA